MKRMKIISLAVIFCCSLCSIGCNTIAQAQSQKLNKKAEHYALDNYAVYATGEMNAEKRRGFHDGLIVGRKYAKRIGVAAPHVSRRYKRENIDYREGFLRGFHAGYHQSITVR